MEIRRALADDRNEIVKYTLGYRKKLYPMLQANMIPGDLIAFESTYINKNNSIFLLAIDDGLIIGTAGVIPYDNRISGLDYPIETTAEIVKLHINPERRREGIAKKLVQELIDSAIKSKYQIAYLHTHHFLNGALEFWVNNGFHVVSEDKSDPLPIIHMERQL